MILAIRYAKTLIYTLIAGTAFCQKPPVDERLCTEFPQIVNSSVSNDGKFVQFVVNNKIGGGTIVIKSTDNRLEKKSTSIPHHSFRLNLRRIVRR